MRFAVSCSCFHFDFFKKKIHVQVIRENWNLKYSACFVLCPVTAPDVTVPFAVSVVSKLRSPPGNVLLVRNTDDDVDLVNTTHITNIPDKIGICVKPFHFDYDSVRSISDTIFFSARFFLPFLFMTH